MKNILLPTDFSDNARNAIHYALEFLKMNFALFTSLMYRKHLSILQMILWLLQLIPQYTNR